MKIVFSTLAVCLVVVASCKKELSLEGQLPAVPPPVEPEKTRLEQFVHLLTSDGFQLRAFYADKPIDYNESDAEIRQETDLWRYASDYLKDDVDLFDASGSTVRIEQHEKKRSGLPDDVLVRRYAVTEESGNISLQFLDYRYEPLTYHLDNFGEGYFVVSVPGPQGSTLYSRFEKVN